MLSIIGVLVVGVGIWAFVTSQKATVNAKVGDCIKVEGDTTVGNPDTSQIDCNDPAALFVVTETGDKNLTCEDAEAEYYQKNSKGDVTDRICLRPNFQTGKCFVPAPTTVQLPQVGDCSSINGAPSTRCCSSTPPRPMSRSALPIPWAPTARRNATTWSASATPERRIRHPDSDPVRCLRGQHARRIRRCTFRRRHLDHDQEQLVVLGDVDACGTRRADREGSIAQIRNIGGGPAGRSGSLGHQAVRLCSPGGDQDSRRRTRPVGPPIGSAAAGSDSQPTSDVAPVVGEFVIRNVLRGNALRGR